MKTFSQVTRRQFACQPGDAQVRRGPAPGRAQDARVVRVVGVGGHGFLYSCQVLDLLHDLGPLPRHGSPLLRLVQREAKDNVLGVLLNDAGEVLPQYYGYRYNYYGYTDEAAGTDA